MIRDLSIHLSPTAPLAERALLPADPGLALGLAQALLEAPRMFNHSRGLWGYTGLADDGLPLTVQSTGIGGPSAAIVLEELAAIGLRRAVRVGTCSVIAPAGGPPLPGGGSPGFPELDEDRPTRSSTGAPGSRLALGDLLIVESAVAADGASRALGAGRVCPADRELVAALGAAGPATRRAVVVSTDVFYAEQGQHLAILAGQPEPLAVDLETAALFTLGPLRKVAVACVLVVTDLVTGGRRARLDDQAIDESCARAGRLGAAGLGAAGLRAAGLGPGRESPS